MLFQQQERKKSNTSVCLSVCLLVSRLNTMRFDEATCATVNTSYPPYFSALSCACALMLLKDNLPGASCIRTDFPYISFTVITDKDGRRNATLLIILILFICQMLIGKQIVFVFQIVGFEILSLIGLVISPALAYSNESNYQVVHCRKTVKILWHREPPMHPSFEVVVFSIPLQEIRRNHCQGYLMQL